MTRTLAIRDECGVGEVMKIESKRKEYHGGDDDADHYRIRATKTRVRDLERRRDRREDWHLRDPVEGIRTIDDERIDHGSIEESGRESDDREHARVADRIAKREQEAETEGQEDRRDHPFVDAVVGLEQECRRKCDRQDHRKDEERCANDPHGTSAAQRGGISRMLALHLRKAESRTLKVPCRIGERRRPSYRAPARFPRPR